MTMATLTDLYINDHCANLGITRDKLTAFVFPDGVTEIGEHAFKGCTSLTSITIPDGVTRIVGEAFQECPLLTQVICNNPDLFTNDNIDNKDQIQFISTGLLCRKLS